MCFEWLIREHKCVCHCLQWELTHDELFWMNHLWQMCPHTKALNSLPLSCFEQQNTSNVPAVPTRKSICLALSLYAIVCHIISWYTQCFEQGNTSNVATHKSVCQALNHCLAHIELVHSLFSTTSPTRQLPAVRSLLKQLFMPGGDGFDEKCKK